MTDNPGSQFYAAKYLALLERARDSRARLADKNAMHPLPPVPNNGCVRFYAVLVINTLLCIGISFVALLVLLNHDDATIVRKGSIAIIALVGSLIVAILVGMPFGTAVLVPRRVREYYDARPLHRYDKIIAQIRVLYGAASCDESVCCFKVYNKMLCELNRIEVEDGVYQTVDSVASV